MPLSATHPHSSQNVLPPAQFSVAAGIPPQALTGTPSDPFMLTFIRGNKSVCFGCKQRYPNPINPLATYASCTRSGGHSHCLVVVLHNHGLATHTTACICHVFGLCGHSSTQRGTSSSPVPLPQHYSQHISRLLLLPSKSSLINFVLYYYIGV